jgi:hypothetical protein
MRRTALALATVAALGLLAAAIAFGNAGSAKDPRGDVKHNPPGPDARSDIVRIAYGHASHGRLVNTVRTRGKVYFNTPGGQTPLLLIDVPGKVSDRFGCQYSDYFVADGEVQECGEGPTTGKAKISKVNAHTLTFVFKPKAIGKPKRYGLAFVEQGPNAKGNGLVFYDRAPNKGFLKHKLR